MKTGVKREMRVRVYPYKAGSRSATALAQALGGLCLRREGSRFRERRGDVIINWGSTDELPFQLVINSPAAVATASNKLRAFQAMAQAGVRVPAFWTNRADAEQGAFPIVCRTILNGHSGRGIVIADDQNGLVDAPLYVQYVKKQEEYRVHVFDGQVIAVQRKARRLDVENPNWQVRNHANGFVFARDGVDPPPDVIEQAQQSIISLGLDFGGVDVIWNERQQQAYVLEINTACGLEGTTVQDYAAAIRRFAYV